MPYVLVVYRRIYRMERNKYKAAIQIYQMSHITVTNPEVVKIPLHKTNTCNFGGRMFHPRN
jgi:hypothetical protein